MIFGLRRKPQITFDDVASDEIKDVRAAINKAADRAIISAARQAAMGNAKSADEFITTARVLRWQAINIPLEMVERKITGVELPE